MKAKISVYLKPGILDPQGKAVLNAINHLSYQGVNNVRIGKYIEIEFDGKDKSQAKKEAEEICDKLLANTVMENYSVEVEEIS